MLKFTMLLLSLCLAIGCRSFNVVVENDAFKGVVVVKADMWHKVIEGKLDNLQALYQKEINNGKITDAFIMLQFRAIQHPMLGYNGEDLEKSAYLLIDAKSYKIDMKDMSTSRNTYLHGNIGPNYAGTSSVTINATPTVALIAKVPLSEQMLADMANAQSLKIRVYTGINPCTLEATSSQLKAVKIFASSTGEMN
jgi:hypothetical protein